LINLYIGDFYYDSNYRPYLVDILKPFFPEKNLAKYHLTNIAFKIIQNRNESFFFLLPFCWNYYVETDTISVAARLIEEARENRKKILIWVTGDDYFSLPQFDNVIGLYTSPYKSRQNVRTIPLPVIIRDPLIFLELDTIKTRGYNETPSIGFCGQADPNLIISTIKMAELIWKKTKYKFHLSKCYPGTATPSTYLRKKVLDILDKTNTLHTEFIRRDRYQGGKSKKDDSYENLRKEFYCNIKNTDYTLCIRGTGNFSARFYETLALGRIPIFINTDCILPFNDVIDWKKHVIWIEQNEISEIETKILQFHHSLTEELFQKIQKENRMLWEKYFKFSGFYKELSILLK